MSTTTQDPAAYLRGRFTDGSAAGFDVAMFGVAMGVPCHSLRRMVHLAEPLMPRGCCLLTVAFYGPERIGRAQRPDGAGEGGAGEQRALQPHEPYRRPRMPHVPSDAGPEAGSVPTAATTAADIMTESVCSVTPETSVRNVARLLAERHISAVPVLDKSGGPVAMVSEGDPLGRSEEAKLARCNWRLEMLAHKGRTETGWKDGTATRPVREVMHAPVVTVESSRRHRALPSLDSVAAVWLTSPRECD